jgi:hypothetical protein
MRMRQVLIVAALLAATAAALVRAEEPAPTLPPCVHAGPPVSLPPEFPKSLPLPPGTVITSAKSFEAGVALVGFVPMELKDATQFFLHKFPAAGFKLGRGEVEQSEAEARFGGNGIVGYFKLRSIPDCPGALDFIIRVQALPSTPSPAPPPK